MGYCLLIARPGERPHFAEGFKTEAEAEESAAWWREFRPQQIVWVEAIAPAKLAAPKQSAFAF
jgi:hypothetical protein